MDPKLSDSMPAQQDSTLAAKMPDRMSSDAPAYAGEGGSKDAPQDPISNQSQPQDAEWQCTDRERGISHETADRVNGEKIGWETTDRNNTAEGGLPQRPDFE